MASAGIAEAKTVDFTDRLDPTLKTSKSDRTYQFHTMNLIAPAYFVLRESFLENSTTLINLIILKIHTFFSSSTLLSSSQTLVNFPEKKWHFHSTISPKISNSESYPSFHHQRSQASPAHQNVSPHYVKKTAKSGMLYAIKDGVRKHRSRIGEMVKSHINSFTKL